MDPRDPFRRRNEVWICQSSSVRTSRSCSASRCLRHTWIATNPFAMDYVDARANSKELCTNVTHEPITKPSIRWIGPIFSNLSALAAYPTCFSPFCDGYIPSCFGKCQISQESSQERIARRNLLTGGGNQCLTKSVKVMKHRLRIENQPYMHFQSSLAAVLVLQQPAMAWALAGLDGAGSGTYYSTSRVR